MSSGYCCNMLDKSKLIIQNNRYINTQREIRENNLSADKLPHRIPKNSTYNLEEINTLQTDTDANTLEEEHTLQTDSYTEHLPNTNTIQEQLPEPYTSNHLHLTPFKRRIWFDCSELSSVCKCYVCRIVVSFVATNWHVISINSEDHRVICNFCNDNLLLNEPLPDFILRIRRRYGIHPNYTLLETLTTTEQQLRDEFIKQIRISLPVKRSRTCIKMLHSKIIEIFIERFNSIFGRCDLCNNVMCILYNGVVASPYSKCLLCTVCFNAGYTHA